MKSKLLIWFFGFLSVFIFFNEDKQAHNLYTADKAGYYIYLPALFIYHDVDGLGFYGHLDSLYQLGLCNDLHRIAPDKILDKYPCGTAVFELPLFMVAHAYCLLTHSFQADGFTMPYQLAGIFSNIIFVLLGLWVLRAFLKKYFSEPVVFFTILCVAFGTNLYTYTVFEQGMSHPYSFFLFSSVLYLTDAWYSSLNKKYVLLLAAVIGLIFIVRPSNIFIVMVPLFWKVYDKATIKNRMVFLKQQLADIGICILIFFAIASLLFAYWKCVTDIGSIILIPVKALIFYIQIFTKAY